MRQSLSSLTRWVVAGVLAGLATGAIARDGFLDVHGTFTTIAVPGATSTDSTTLHGINNAGQIVGTFQDSTGRLHGFLDAGGTFSIIDMPGATYTKAFGINDAGHIVGQSSLVPEPGSLVLFSVGLLGLGLAWWCEVRSRGKSLRGTSNKSYDGTLSFGYGI